MIARTTVAVACLVWACAALLVAGPALGQVPERVAPAGEVTDEVMDRLIDWFALDTAQADDAFSLYDAYREDLTAARASFIERRAGVEDDEDDWGGSAERVEAMRAELDSQRVALREGLFEDVRVLLGDDQLALWPAWERAVLRWDELPRLPFRAAQINLFGLVRDAPLTEAERERAEPVLLAYGHELDEALRAWVERRDATVARLDAAERYDPERAVRSMRPALREAWAIGDVQRRHLAEIGEAVGERGARNLREAFDRAAYPGLFRGRYFDLAIERALGLETLDADQLESLIALDEEHGRRRLDLIHKQARAFEAMGREALAAPVRPEDARGHYALLEGRATGLRYAEGDGARDFNALESSRRALDNDLIPRLFRVLTPEQRAQLPVRTAQSEGRPLTAEEIEMIRPLYLNDDDTGAGDDG